MFKPRSNKEILYEFKQKREEELLEIFLLIEENTMSAKVNALMRYSRLYNIKDKLKANDEMKKAYAEFNSKTK